MRRYPLAPVIVVALLWSGSAPHLGHAQTGPVTFYVATNGNNAWSGRLPAPGAADGPFATVQRARDAVRELKLQQGGSLRQPVTIEIREGTYFLGSTLQLTPQDSGTADAPITYAAYQDERPVISGGRPVTGWRPLTVDGKDVWAAYIPEALRPTYGGRGIYFDEGTTGVLAEHNIVYRVTDGVFNLHYGRANVVRNNIFALSSARTGAAPSPPGQIQRGNDSGDPQLQLTFETNIVYWRQGTLFGGATRDFSARNMAFDRNVYWKDGGNTTASSGVVSWDAWQASGMDRNSVIANPLFEAPDQGNFGLKPDSPAWRLGWQPIDLSRVGPRSSQIQRRR